LFVVLGLKPQEINKVKFHHFWWKKRPGIYLAGSCDEADLLCCSFLNSATEETLSYSTRAFMFQAFAKEEVAILGICFFLFTRLPVVKLCCLHSISCGCNE